MVNEGTPLALPPLSLEDELRALLTFRRSDTEAVFAAYYALRAEAGQASADAVLREHLGPVHERLVLQQVAMGPEPDPNRCRTCGCSGSSHIMASLGQVAKCGACNAFHAFEGGWLPDDTPSPPAPPPDESC
mgnify:CR=1 FL=1